MEWLRETGLELLIGFVSGVTGYVLLHGIARKIDHRLSQRKDPGG